MAGGGIGTIVIRSPLFSISGVDLNSVTDILGGGQAANYKTENVASDEVYRGKRILRCRLRHLEDYWNGVFEAETDYVSRS